jgi:hypothetical protein
LASWDDLSVAADRRANFVGREGYCRELSVRDNLSTAANRKAIVWGIVAAITHNSMTNKELAMKNRFSSPLAILLFKCIYQQIGDEILVMFDRK